MPPALLFIGLFALLMLLYWALAGTIGAVPTFVVQAVLVLALTMGLIWHRQRKGRDSRMEPWSDDEEPPASAPPPRS
jgi:hypothetical protein